MLPSWLFLWVMRWLSPYTKLAVECGTQLWDHVARVPGLSSSSTTYLVLLNFSGIQCYHLQKDNNYITQGPSKKQRYSQIEKRLTKGILTKMGNQPGSVKAPQGAKTALRPWGVIRRESKHGFACRRGPCDSSCEFQ